MKKQDLSKMATIVLTSVSKHSPEILTGIGVSGLILTTILAVKATPKAIDILEEEKKSKAEESYKDEEVKEVELTKTETVKATWKCYVPAAVTGTVSVACIIGANHINAKRSAALTAAYTLAETARQEYRDKVIDILGIEDDRKVRESIAEDHASKDKEQLFVTTTRDRMKFCDAAFGREFYSDIHTVEQAEIEINRKILNNQYASLNEFYMELDLNLVERGDDLGWNTDNLVSLDFSPRIMPNGEVVVDMNYINPPNYKYDTLF